MLKGETSQQEEPETPKRLQCLRARITPASLQEDLQFKHGTVYSKLWPTTLDKIKNLHPEIRPAGVGSTSDGVPDRGSYRTMPRIGMS